MSRWGSSLCYLEFPAFHTYWGEAHLLACLQFPAFHTCCGKAHLFAYLQFPAFHTLRYVGYLALLIYTIPSFVMLLFRLFPHVPGIGRPFLAFFPRRFQTTFFADFYAGAGSLKFLFPLNPGEMMNKTLINSTFLLINSVTNLFLTIAGRSGGEAVRGAWYSRSQLCAGEFIRQSC